jgi:hypothetical protein
MQPTGSFLLFQPRFKPAATQYFVGVEENFVDVPTDCPQRDERLDGPVMHRFFARPPATM